MIRVLLIIGALALTIFAVIDLLSVPAGEVRGGSRLLWALAIVLVPVVGPVMWLWLGRATDGPRYLGPDDDPDFLGGFHSQ